MKKRTVLPVVLAIFCGLGVLSAGQKVEVEWVFVSSPKPIYKDMVLAQPAIPDGLPLFGGVRPREELMRQFRRARASVWVAPKVVCASGRRAVVENMVKVPAVTLEGNFAKYGVKYPDIRPSGDVELGYRLACRPKAGSDGVIALELDMKLVSLSGFMETLLNGPMPEAVARGQGVAAAGDFPRVKSLILEDKAVKTGITAYDGQTVVLGMKKKSGQTEYILITARIVESPERKR